MVKVQFPLSETNHYWDGKEHDIVPRNLVKLNNTDYYYMDGYDNTFNTEMMTLLRKNENGFNKVPLDNYDEFGALVTSVDLEFYPAMLVGNKIDLDPAMTVEELRNEIKSKKM